MKFFTGLIVALPISLVLWFLIFLSIHWAFGSTNRRVDLLESAEVNVINSYLAKHPECELVNIDRTFGMVPRAWFRCTD